VCAASGDSRASPSPWLFVRRMLCALDLQSRAARQRQHGHGGDAPCGKSWDTTICQRRMANGIYGVLTAAGLGRLFELFRGTRVNLQVRAFSGAARRVSACHPATPHQSPRPLCWAGCFIPSSPLSLLIPYLRCSTLRGLCHPATCPKPRPLRWEVVTGTPWGTDPLADRRERVEECKCCGPSTLDRTTSPPHHLDTHAHAPRASPWTPVGRPNQPQDSVRSW
jgi:hypothetical protein